jgi:lipopolysaccharide transport system ATP-binding protein
MNSAHVIEVKGISKRYAVFQSMERYLALRDALTSLLRAPFTLFSKKRSGTTHPFWALKDVHFSVKKGEILGVIGRNGAGKSTLLKILNRITEPTEGEIHVHGSISALLEVGTGFHPELTGRENIYFSGAILGMRRKEIDEKFERIVEFAEVAEFLDTPVKRYSSGMQVRLAFSVAIHMEPDILLIDEVLAVGDAAFQKKCLDKIHDAARKDGRTILFVSHNLDVVESLCDRVVYLEKGKVKMVGETDQVVKAYLQSEIAKEGAAAMVLEEDSKKKYQLLKATLRDEQGVPQTEFSVEKPFFVDIDYVVREPKSVFWITLQCVNEQGTLVFVSADCDKNATHYVSERSLGRYTTTFTMPTSLALALNSGRYTLTVKIHQDPSLEVTLPLIVTNAMGKFANHPGTLLIGEPWGVKKIA